MKGRSVAYLAVAILLLLATVLMSNFSRSSLDCLITTQSGGGEAMPEPWCEWQFVRYVPSRLEVEYYKRSDAEQRYPCKTMKHVFPNESLVLMNSNHIIYNHPPGKVRCNLEPVEPSEDVFSHLIYNNTCNGESKRVFIEPLVGILRHPATCVKNKNANRRDYLLLDGWHSNKKVLAPGAKKYFFDLGASTWTAGGGGASQEWFFDMFSRICAEFDGIFGWEYTVHAPETIFKQIPPHIHHKYHWYNIPVTVDFTSQAHPFNMIRKVATKEDYVVLKIDIDTPEVELPLIQYMLANPDILSLVDEFFFEHHVLMQPMVKLGWGAKVNGTPRDSIDIFTKMRNNGVRAHSWV